MIVQNPIRRPRRGLGFACSDGPGAPWSWQRTQYSFMGCGKSPVTYAETAINSAQGYQNPPTPPAPTVDLLTDPEAAGAVYAGESNGIPVYAVPETATDNVARLKDSVDQFFVEQGNRTPPSDPCGHWFSMFDPECPGAGIPAWMLAAGAVVGGLVLVNLTGGRR